MKQSLLFISVAMTVVVLLQFDGGRQEDGTVFMSTLQKQKQELKAAEIRAALSGGRTDKAHLEYYFFPRLFNSERSISDGLRDGFATKRSQEQLHSLRKSAIGSTWTFLGPDNIGGRMRTVDYHPTDSNIVYAGSASGGLWKSVNGGASWMPLTDHLPTLAVGSFAFHPDTPETMFIGTGEGSGNMDAVYGDGVYKSTDGGSSWTNIMDGVITNYNLAINDLAVHPEDGNLIYAAAAYASNGALLRTTDGGENWQSVISGVARQVEIDPAHPDRVLVLMADPDGRSSNGLYISDSSGRRDTFVPITEGLPPADSLGNAQFDISPSDPSKLILLAQRSYRARVQENRDFLGMWRSADGGLTWQRTKASNQGNLQSVFRDQGDYNLFVNFHPSNSDIVIIGGIEVWRSTDNAENFLKVSSQYSQTSSAWVDQHVVAFNPLNPNIMIVGSDGGLFRSPNITGAPVLFQEINNDLATMQFYAMDFDRSNPGRLCGGTQDRRNNLGVVGDPSWQQLPWSGDGGYVAFDYSDEDVFYVTSQFGNIGRTTNGGVTFTGANNGLEKTTGDGRNLFAFVTPFVMHPTNSNVLFTGGNKMYRTDNKGFLWKPISPDLTGAEFWTYQMQDVAYCRSNTAVVYAVNGAGTKCFKSVNAMDAVDQVVFDELSRGLPNLFLTSVAVHPTDPDIAYVGASGFSLLTGVYRTTNGGERWYQMRGESNETKLPFVPTNHVAIHPSNPEIIFAATDVGVYVSVDAGLNWQPFGDGLPNVVVDHIKITDNDIIYAATHGRGMWMASINLVSSGQSPAVEAFSLGQNYPNPFNPGTGIPFTLTRRSHVRLTVLDASGRTVATLIDGLREAGQHRQRFDGTALPSGIYFYRLESGGQSLSRKMVLMK